MVEEVVKIVFVAVGVCVAALDFEFDVGRGG